MRKLSGFAEYIVFLIGYGVLILALTGIVVLIGGTAAWARIDSGLTWALTPIGALPEPIGALLLIVIGFSVPYLLLRRVCRMDREAAGMLTGVLACIAVGIAGIIGG